MHLLITRSTHPMYRMQKVRTQQFTQFQNNSINKHADTLGLYTVKYILIHVGQYFLTGTLSIPLTPFYRNPSLNSTGLPTTASS